MVGERIVGTKALGIELWGGIHVPLPQHRLAVNGRNLLTAGGANIVTTNRTLHIAMEDDRNFVKRLWKWFAKGSHGDLR